MPVICVQGLRRLNGEIRIQGSKNAVLPVMAASLLCRGTVIIANVPLIEDVFCMLEILRTLGCRCDLREHVLTVDARDAAGRPVPEEACRSMRSSIMLLGPLLGRFGAAQIWYPGGCSIGSRPIDLHLGALRSLGAQIVVEGEQIRAQTSGLHGAKLRFLYPSVGATENAVMAAVASEGTTRISGAAREPEIEALCDFLRTLGAGISGIGSGTLTVTGGSLLHGGAFTVPGDRIVAGTYLGAALTAGGELLLRGAPEGQMGAALAAASRMGAEIAVEPRSIRIKMTGRPRPVSLTTEPYPGFPTDLQSVMLAAASVAEGDSFIRETVFEERFSTAKELRKLGAHIIINGGTAAVEGRWPLCGGSVSGRDLRGGAALAVAGLAAEGTTFVDGYAHIRRGYEDICGDLAGAGAEICLKDIDRRKEHGAL
ncbi:MAG: UDP-N-acetylglucosamine 1-carboxyvinyltransferase [Clostridiales bacterium]|nr:UDP-N-acetylglucosamine 1-carboxyvinyltransferase [Clostridiales bacterium]